MIKRYAVFLFAALLLVSCVSSPKAQGKAPDWTLTTPPADGTNTYFVGYSSDPAGDAAKAAEGATANLLASVMNYIGVKITVDSSATARASYESYQADIVQSVRTQSTNRLAGFMVKDRHQIKDKKSGRVTVYILAAYATRDLEAEKTRIQKLFQEQIDAVAVPENRGKGQESEGRYFEAIESYIEAAVAASGADIDNADIKLERNINNARRVLGRLRFVPAAPPNAGLGKPFSGPFAAKLVYGESDSGPGIPGAEAFVTYQVRQASGRITGKTERAVSDSRGVFSFTPPPPNFVGKAKLVMRLNLDSSLVLLDKFPARFDAHRQALEAELRGRTAEFEYTVASVAKDVATGVALVELDEKGQALGSSQVQAGLLEALTRQKFKAQAAPLDGAVLESEDGARILAAARAAYKGKFARILAGVARIESVRKDGSNYMVAVRASVRCWDLATGELLYTAEKAYTGVGPEEAAARRASLQQLGRDSLGRDLMANLP